MSNTDELDEIRATKREQMERRLAGEDGAEEEAAGATPGEPVHVEDAAHFEELTGSGVVLVDFHAEWCGPCKMLEPTVEALAAETDATVAKVDIDAHADLARQYGVQGVPTVMLFADGEPVERLVGVRDRSAYESAIAQHV